MQVSSIKYTNTSKAYFALRGKPFIILGTQIRLDGLLHRPATEEHKDLGKPPKPLTNTEIERYFIEAKDMGFNTLQVPVDWRFIEPDMDVYKYDLLDFVLNLGKKYKLKIELLWFSTNMCGDSHSNHLPDYIFWDKETYPRIKAESNGQYVDEDFHLMYGYSGFLVLNDPLLMERETLVLKRLMTHIYNWNVVMNFPDTVISVQVHNEPDGFARWRIDQRKPKLNGSLLTKEEAWKMTLDALDNAGKAIKSSEYKVVTRANMTVSLDMDSFKEFPKGSAKDIIKLEGIDIVGDDPYVTKPSEIMKSIESYAQERNYPHIAENMGSYTTTPKLILTAVLKGASYSVYDFATPEYFIWMNQGSDYQMDQGIVNPDFSYKSQTQETIEVLSILKKAEHIIALANHNCIFAFNNSDTENEVKKSEMFIINNKELKISTNEHALGYVIIHQGYAYISMTHKVLLTTDLVKSSNVKTGYFKEEEFVMDDIVEFSNEILAGKLYQFKLK